MQSNSQSESINLLMIYLVSIWSLSPMKFSIQAYITSLNNVIGQGTITPEIEEKFSRALYSEMPFVSGGSWLKNIRSLVNNEQQKLSLDLNKIDNLFWNISNKFFDYRNNKILIDDEQLMTALKAVIVSRLEDCCFSNDYKDSDKEKIQSLTEILLMEQSSGDCLRKLMLKSMEFLSNPKSPSHEFKNILENITQLFVQTIGGIFENLKNDNDNNSDIHQTNYQFQFFKKETIVTPLLEKQNQPTTPGLANSQSSEK